jgi:hypothetical protein
MIQKDIFFLFLATCMLRLNYIRKKHGILYLVNELFSDFELRGEKSIPGSE